MTLWTLVLHSCGKDSSEEAVRRADDRVVWKMVLGNAPSRAAMDASGSGRFESGDTIVVHTRNLAAGIERRYTLRLSNGAWEPEIHWSEIGQEVEFTAWHLAPARGLHEASLASSGYQHPLAVDQRGEGYAGSDLLWAQGRGRAGETVSLNFSHALSRLHVVLESRDATYSDADLQQAVVEVRTPVRAAFDLAGGTLQTVSDSRWITPARGGRQHPDRAAGAATGGGHGFRRMDPDPDRRPGAPCAASRDGGGPTLRRDGGRPGADLPAESAQGGCPGSVCRHHALGLRRAGAPGRRLELRSHAICLDGGLRMVRLQQDGSVGGHVGRRRSDVLGGGDLESAPLVARAEWRDGSRRGLHRSGGTAFRHAPQRDLPAVQESLPESGRQPAEGDQLVLQRSLPQANL